MNLLHPLGLLALLAVPVLIALSLWRWRRREVVVPSLILWRDVASAWRQAPHARRRRQLDPLLLLRVAVALALTAALCGPAWLSTSRSARRIAIVLDRSASMAAPRPDGLTRWRAARDQLLTLLARAEAADRVELVPVPPPAGRTAPAELSPREAASLLLSLEPSDAHVEPQELRRAAVEAERREPIAGNGHPAASGGVAQPRPAVVVATDGPVPGLPATVGLLATGAPARNLGITAFAARARGDGLHEVLVTVANAAAAPASTTVVLRSGGREVARRTVAVPPSAAKPIIVEAKLGPAAVLEASIEDPFGLRADDQAWLARRTERLRVALVGGGNYYLRRALAVQDAVELIELPEPPESAVPRGCGLAVYYHAAPRRLAGGSVVVVAPTAPVGALKPGPLVEAGPASVIARGDPLMAAVRLESVPLGAVAKPSIPAGFVALASAGGVPLIGRWREEGTAITYVGIDPAASSWPLDTSFPIFWANVVADAAGRGAEAGEFGCTRPGQAVRVGVVAGDAVLEDPQGARHPLREGALRPERVGLYRILAGKEERPVAVSLLSTEETLAAGSEARLSPDFFPRADGGAVTALTWRLGGWLALLALGIVLLHGCLAARSHEA